MPGTLLGASYPAMSKSDIRNIGFIGKSENCPVGSLHFLFAGK